jgi:hypothetical protein
LASSFSIRRGFDRDAGRDEILVDLEAAGGDAAQAQQRKAVVGLERVEIRHQAQVTRQVGHRRRRRFAVQVLGIVFALAEAGIRPGLPTQRAILAVDLERGQGGMESETAFERRQIAKSHLGRQQIVLGCAVDFAVGEDQRQLGDAQHVGLEGIAVDRQPPHAPAIRMQGGGGFVQARLVVAVLLLEMLGAQEQALAPQDLGRCRHALPPRRIGDVFLGFRKTLACWKHLDAH